MNTPTRQIRADYDDRTIRVYQAYGDAIAVAALRKGTFCGPFRMSRMTWIKPSFFWMMYRCGWAEKEGQTRVLAIDITREGFEWALRHASLSHYEPNVHPSLEAWTAQKEASPVRVQWDPERSSTLHELNYRSIQIGLSGKAVELYVNEWIVRIDDVTGIAQKMHALIKAGRADAIESLSPDESPYPTPEDIQVRLGMSQPSASANKIQ